MALPPDRPLSDRRPPIQPVKGRGAVVSPDPRFDSQRRRPVDDGWERDDEAAVVATVLTAEQARTIITRNRSPDIPFDRSINAYRGCEHGCVYCYARPSHAYVDLSPGLDFETRIGFKPNAAALLRSELAKPGYVPQPIAMGTNTDPYQPAERSLGITRSLLEVLLEHGHPTTITTKGALIERDIDLLAQLAERNLVSVAVSVTTLDNALKRGLEPRTPSGSKRLAVVRALNAQGIPVTVMFAPVIPFVNDAELETIVGAAAAAGARGVRMIVLRLPGEVSEMFRAWLETYTPDRASRVMKVIQSLRGGRDYEATFGKRMSGEGVYSELLFKRLATVSRKHGLLAEPSVKLATEHFRVPARASRVSPQLALF